MYATESNLSYCLLYFTSALPTSFANEYMKDHIFELQRKIWRHDWSSLLCPQLKQLWNYGLKKIQTWTGFEPVISGAVLYQLSYQANWELVISFIYSFAFFIIYGYITNSQCDQGPVSRKPRKLFGPLKPFLVYLYLKAEKCIRLKLLV